jgi:hypothetical protein
MYDKIKEDKPRLFQWLYEPPRTATTTDDPMIYTNSSRWINVHMAEDDQRSVPEYVFVCLTIREVDDQENVIVYYVSREYNLSDTPNPYIAGRFLFAESALDSRRIEIHNVAEEPAKILAACSADAERLYLLQKAQNEPGKFSIYTMPKFDMQKTKPSRTFTEEDEDDDPLCSLSRRERLRICAQVLSSAYFEVDLKFTPDYHFIDETECAMNEITFQDDEVMAEAPERYYEEWMIGCRPDQYYASYQAEYFVSRVYDSFNKVFVYRRAPDSKIVIENMFGDVRFNVY